MKKVLILIALIFSMVVTSPVFAGGGLDNDGFTDWITDCEEFPLASVCANYVPVNSTEQCVKGAWSNWKRAEYQAILEMPTRDPQWTIEEVRGMANAGTLGTVLVWYKVSRVYDHLTLADSWKAIYDGRKEVALSGIKMESLEDGCTYEIPEENDTGNTGNTDESRDENGCKVEDDGQLDCG